MKILMIDDKPVLDLTVLKELDQYGEEGVSVLLELVELYLRDSQLRLQRLRASVITLNPEEIERGAHSLGGSSATLGVARVADVCRALEETAAKGDLTDAVKLFSLIEVEALKAQGALACRFAVQSR